MLSAVLNDVAAPTAAPMHDMFDGAFDGDVFDFFAFDIDSVEAPLTGATLTAESTPASAALVDA